MINKIISRFIYLAITLVILTSCNNNRLIRDKYLRSDIESRFDQVSKFANKRSAELFQIFSDLKLTGAEVDGLKYYLASMPLSDLADYNSYFYLENIRKSIDAKKHFSWSADIPDHIFLQYVLPIRVNNENLDSFRIKYYDELAARVRGFNDIEKAALEINHWCHEKVSYQGADIRTSAPMATIMSTRGRCGEESTLAVAALRSVGIPARQVYVPRWAHSDDNHAWVEIWVNGKWKYMGACEPEPVLNRGWFTEAASRAMLIHTKSFGKYYGKEDLVRRYEYYAEINNLAMYADVSKLTVRATDSCGEPVAGADVKFGLYNYSEFYPIAETITDSAGYTSFVSGLGNLLVWCSKNENYGFKLVSVSETDSLEIITEKGITDGTTFKFNLRAPAPTRNNPPVSAEQIRENALRLKNEDGIRERYKSLWIDSAGIIEFADRSGYKFCEISSPIKRSMGNYRAIVNFLDQIDINKKGDALVMLNMIADKDLRDTPYPILIDHLKNARNFYFETYTEEIFNNYILNPRIANEIITPWRAYLQNYHDYDTILEFRNNPSDIVRWIDKNVSIAEERNYYKVPISPRGSIELAYSDYHSRRILFVALCRSYGIPARLEEGTDLAQYYQMGEWRNIKFADEPEDDTEYAELTLRESGEIESAEYYTNFTLAYVLDGAYKTLDYTYGKKINDFDWPLKLRPGSYMLVSGNRLNSNEVLSEIVFFELAENESREIEFSIRKREQAGRVLQNISPETNIFVDDKYISLYDTNGKGTVIAWINHEKEPTKHLLRELAEKSEQFMDWGGKMILISDSTLLTPSFKPDSDSNLQKICSFGFDSNYRVLNNLFPEIDPNNISLPVLIFVNTENEIIYKSEGYQIGLSDQLIALINTQKK